MIAWRMMLAHCFRAGWQVTTIPEPPPFPLAWYHPASGRFWP